MHIANRRTTLALTLLTCAIRVQAAPMSFKDSAMLMGDLSGNWQELQSNYAFTTRDAIGGSITRMRSDDGRPEERLIQAEYTRRLMRWNQPDSQSNLWLISGIGQWQDAHRTHPMLTPGIQADYETTRVYASALARLYRADGVQRDVVSSRFGVSFFEAAYEDTQPWVVLEVRRMHDVSARIEATPMLRLVNRRFFAELGMSQSAHLRANFMYTF